MSKVTYNAIKTMLFQGNGKGDQFIVQAFNVKNKKGFLKLEIKDEFTTIKAAIFINQDTQHLNIPQVCKKIDGQQRYLIKIASYAIHEEKKGAFMIQILDFAPLHPIKETMPYVKTQSQITQTKISIKKQEPTQQMGYRTQKKGNQAKRPIEPINYTPKQVQRTVDDNQELDEARLRQFEKISDLYIDFQGRWQIVVRVLQKSYRVFTNKSNKITKIFQMTLVDRTGMKIEGVMFGDEAKDYHDLIRQNTIYRISRGQVRQQTYKKNKGSDYSRYNIIFTKNSIFIPCKDLKFIPRSQKSDTTIEHILYENNFQKLYNLVVILLQIGQERVFNKDDREIYKKDLTVGDPITQKSIDLIIWSKQLLIDPSWEGKAIYLKNVKLSSYKDSFSLYSTFKSQIKLKQNHKFSTYENKLSSHNFQNISDVIVGKNSNIDKIGIKTFRELQDEIKIMNFTDIIYSNLQVWLTHISFKGKWYYDPCGNNKCKKAAESFTNCIHCGHYNDKVSHRFILPVQISDHTGSIFISGFQQFGSEIFKGQTIDDLLNLDENDLRQLAECKLYKQYKIKISTKRDSQGNIKHNINGKPIEVNIQKCSLDNLQKIRTLLF